MNYIANIPLNYDFQIIKSLRDIHPDQWSLVHRMLPVSMNYEYLLMIEQEHCNDIEFHYSIIRKNSKVVGLICFQLINFEGAYVKNFFRTEVKRGFFQKIFMALFYRILDFVNWKLLTTGNIYFTGDNGIFLDDSVSKEDGVIIIDESFKRVHKMSKKVTAYMVNNVYDGGDESVHRYLKRQKYAAYPVDPDMFLKLDNQWENFDEYRESLTSKYRVRLKKVFKDSKSIVMKKLTHDEIGEVIDQLHALYMNTAEKVDLNLGYLCPNYFLNMSKIWGDQFFVMTYCLNGEMVGFMSILMEEDDLDINYMGMNYEYNRSYKLYNRMLLDLVKVGIDLKTKKMHLGRTATEMKSTVGADAIPMHIYLTSPNRIVDKCMRLFEPYFGSPSYTVRHPFKNKIKSNGN